MTRTTMVGGRRAVLWGLVVYLGACTSIDEDNDTQAGSSGDTDTDSSSGTAGDTATGSAVDTSGTESNTAGDGSGGATSGGSSVGTTDQLPTATEGLPACTEYDTQRECEADASCEWVLIGDVMRCVNMGSDICDGLTMQACETTPNCVWDQESTICIPG